MKPTYNVQSLRHMVPMRFRLTEKKALSLKNNQKGLLSNIKTPKVSSGLLQDTLFELKFCKQISENHLIIGNQYQLNLLNLTGVTSDYAQISSEWTLAFGQKITGLSIANRLHKLFVICGRCLYCYGYRNDSIETPPIFYQKISLEQTIMEIYIPKKDYLMVFKRAEFCVFEMYNPGGMFEFKEIARKQYREKNDLRFVGIPHENGFSFTVFLSKLEDNQTEKEIDMTATLLQQKDKLTLFSIRITFDRPTDIQVSPVLQFCQIPVSHRDKDSLAIQHYRDDIYLVVVGLSVMAVRHNYIINEINFHTSKTSSFIRILSPSSLLHFERETIDRYLYQLEESRKPQQFKLNCIDSLQMGVPQKSCFFSVNEMGERLVFIYQQIRSCEQNQLNFWVGVSDSIMKEQKIKQIFPQKIGPEEELGTAEIDQRVKQACKIGFSKSEAYYQLWNRSTKSTKRNYELLIATQNYTIIREELEKKFKVRSLSYQEVFMILKSSLAMLKEKILQKCSYDVIKQYSMCHFLCSKVEMFQKIHRNINEGSSEESAPDICISIQDYYYLNHIQLQSELFKLLNEFLIERKEAREIIKIKIRALLSQFSLIFRILYPSLLPKMVDLSVEHFKQLITQIPQILPVEESEDQSADIKDRIWFPIDLEKTETFFIIEHIRSLNTYPFVEEFLSSKFCKVYQWNLHGTIAESVPALKANLVKHDVNFIFTQLFAILHLQKEKIHQRRRERSTEQSELNNVPKKHPALDEELIDEIIKQVETYKLLPARLRGKFRFYSELYKRFNNFYSYNLKGIIDAIEFFSLSEDELFQLYFLKERAEKGIFILKQIKPIYEKSAANGIQIFLRNMFNFFKADESSWSDLKVILNKFNNQKEDFHHHNQDIIDVVIKAIMEKVYIGTSSPKELDLRQVMSYIENIPIVAKDSDLLRNMIAIQDIFYEQTLLKKIKINMSLRDIVDRGEEVIFKMMEHEISQYSLWSVTNSKQLLMYAYNIMFSVNEKQSKLYLDKHINFPFKAFLIIVMQKEEFIPLCVDTIKDSYLTEQFAVNDSLMENIVLYLYKKKLYLNQSSPSYVNKLVALLDLNNNKAKFIVLTQAFEKTFNFKNFKIQYPYFMSYYPNPNEIQKIVGSLSREEVGSIDYMTLFDITYMLKMLGENCENIKQTKYHTPYTDYEKKCKLKLQIFIIFFIKFRKEELFQKGLEIARHILSIKAGANRISDIIFPIFLMQIIQEELLVRVQEPVVKLVSYYFYQPSSLLQIISELTNPDNRFSHEEIDQLVNQKLSLKKNELIYDPKNTVFSDAFKELVSSMSPEEQVRTINPLFDIIWKQISKTREDFAKNYIYSIMYRILLHDPLTLAEYIYRKHNGINVKSLRALITLLGFESCFDMNHLFQIGQSIFEVLFTKLQAGAEKDKDIDESFLYSQEYIDELTKLTAQDLVGSSIKIMKEKCQIHICFPYIEKSHEAKMNEITIMIKDPMLYLKNKEEQSYLLHQRLYPQRYSKQKKLQIVQEMLNRDNQYHHRYPFDDDDLEYTEAKYDLSIPFMTYEPSKVDFNDVQERSEIHILQLYQHKQIYKEPRHNNAETASQFEQLYVNIFKSKIVGTKDSICIVRKLKSDHMKIAEDDDKNKFQSLFQKKCLEGGFLSMLKKAEHYDTRKAGTNYTKNVFPSELLKPLEESEILSESEKPKESSISLNYHDLNIDIDSLLIKQANPDLSFIPQFQDEKEKTRFFKKMVMEIYQKEDESLQKRANLLWLIKTHIFGPQAVNQSIREIVTKVSRSELISDLFTPIEAIFSEHLFLQPLSVASLLSLVKKNIGEQVYLLDDYIKLARIVGEVFNSQIEEEEIKISFLVKECKKLNSKESEQIKQDVIEIMQHIKPERIDQCIQEFKCSPDEEERAMTWRLKMYKQNLGQTSHLFSQI